MEWTPVITDKIMTAPIMYILPIFTYMLWIVLDLLVLFGIGAMALIAMAFFAIPWNLFLKVKFREKFE